MIRDALTIHHASRTGPIVGFRGVAGSMLIHVTLLTAVVSFDAYLHTRPQGRAGGAGGGAAANAANAAGDPAADPTAYSPALARGGQFGANPQHQVSRQQRPEQQRPDSLLSAEVWQRPAAHPAMTMTLGTLTDHLWQSTVFAAAVALLTLAFRRQRARVRYWLWLSASIKFLVPFTPIVALGSLLGSLLTWPAAIQAIAHHPIVAGIGEPLGNVNASVAAMLPSASTPLGWFGLALSIIWAIGFVTIVSSRVRAWRQLRALVAASKPMELPGVEIPPGVTVRSAPGLLEPGVIGWQRPVLLMPADIADHLEPEEIAAIVAHELCHVRRQDNLTASLHMIAEALFWFHPAVWWIGARLIDERERACDEHVLQTVGQPRSYAQGILNVCKRYAASPLASVPGVSSSNVKKRIDAILANRVGEAIGPWQKMILGTAIALVFVVPLGAGAVYGPRFAVQVQEMVFVPRPADEMVFVPKPDGGATPGSSGAEGAGSAEGADASATKVAYALVVVDPLRPLGPRLTRSPMTYCDAASAAAAQCGAGGIGRGEMSATAVTPTELARLISAALDRPVEDRTRLTGRFTMKITWAPETGQPAIFTAVREQLGLTLVPIGLAARATHAETVTVSAPLPPAAATRSNR